MADDATLRAQLVKLLDSKEAHGAVDAAGDGVPLRTAALVPRGWQYSIWQLVEHIRLAQADILDFSVNPTYEERLKWPADYWPKARGPKTSAAWKRALGDYRRDLEAMKDVARGTADLFATVPRGTGQTYPPTALLVADHTAYHVGQIVALRRQLGIWK